jgi:predicted amidohydrolase YtcJ
MTKVLLHNGAFWTLDPARPEAEALVIHRGRILAVGTRRDLESLLAPGDRRIDLGGRRVLPGLIDAHTHFAWFSFMMDRVQLDGVENRHQALARVRDAAAKAPPGRWVLGGGWNANLWDRLPDRTDLDSVSPHNPVALDSKDGHSLWVNSLALTMAGITAAAPDPAGGKIERDVQGEPTGILRENATRAVVDAIPNPSPAHYRSALKRGMVYAHSRGVTGIHDCEDGLAFRAFQDLERSGELALRVFMMIPEKRLAEAIAVGLTTGFGNDLLRVGCIKVFGDGALGSQTAWLLQPYEGRPGYCGIATHTPQELRQIVSEATHHGLAVALHAIGDRTNREALDAFEASWPESQARGLRHRIEHAQFIHPDDIPRFGALDVIASVQPSHAPSDRYLADRYWGLRARYAYPFRSLRRSGARLAFGSDVPVEVLDPLKGMYAVVTRKRENEPESHPWYPEESLTLQEAIHGFTLGAAYASGEEHSKGSLVPGKLADLAILDRDILVGPPEVLLEASAEATILGGRLVYRRDPAFPSIE